MPSKSITKVLRSPPLYDCTSCIGGLFLHPIACLNILAWLCITQAEENNHQYSFCNRNLTMKWSQKWNTGFIPNAGCFMSYLAERELVEKAAAGYWGLIWRRSPADLSRPGRLCHWLKGSSTLEVFGIDCSKLHHKPPWRGMFSPFHVMKAGKADWHDDWARWDVKSPASFRNPAPSPSRTSQQQWVLDCMRYGAYRWWWADGAAVLVLMLAVSVMPWLPGRFFFFFFL